MNTLENHIIQIHNAEASVRYSDFGTAFGALAARLWLRYQDHNQSLVKLFFTLDAGNRVELVAMIERLQE